MRRVLFATLLTLLPSTALAQLDLSSMGQATIVDFAGFTGAGLSATPGAGELDSNIWRITGLSDGDTTFGGGPYTSGDYAKGQSAGGVSSGGIYAFTVTNGSATSTALGVQPTGSDFTPGTATLLARNSTGSVVTSVAFSMRYCVLNNGDRANTLVVEYSTDDTTYQQVGNIIPVSTPEASDANAAWVCTQVSSTITGLSLASAGLIYFRLSSDDDSGSGSRDEFGVDEISLTLMGSTPADMGVDTVATPDAGVPDSASPDAGMPDSATPADSAMPADTGTPVDSATPADTGTPADSATSADTGTPADSGSPSPDSGSSSADSGSPSPDSGSTSGGGDDGGCALGGGVEHTAPTLTLLGLLMLVALRRRRRRRR